MDECFALLLVAGLLAVLAYVAGHPDPNYHQVGPYWDAILMQKFMFY